MIPKPYRVGIIGCGWVSTGHMNGYNAVEAVQVVAAADPDRQRLERFSQEYGVEKCYTDHAEMLREEHLDIASVCTWPDLHCPVTVDSASSGVKAVLCEKPMTLGLRDANAMIEACEQHDCRLVVCHQRRFESRYVKAMNLLETGEIGRLLRVEAYQGDLFTDDHGIDLIRFFAGDVAVRWVMGQVDWQNRQLCSWGHVIEDAAMGYIKFENDVEGLVLAGRAREGHDGYSMVLTGTEGTIRISGGNYPAESWVAMMNSKTADWQRFDVEAQLLGTPRTEILARPTIEYYWIDAWQRVVETMVGCIGNDKEHVLSGRQAMKTLEVIAAFYESSRLRSVVHFPLSSEVDRPLEAMEKADAAQMKENIS
jgi:UDP-N-acetylglucosamine 3-dehydrogenase